MALRSSAPSGTRPGLPVLMMLPISRQLGHTDTTMVKKHYGRWIPNDTKSLAGLVSQMMGFRQSNQGTEEDHAPRFLP